eukprot:GFUD01006160.1.p1 GENE.GFUD01006160.1~~GFUD01006160.1.p1  ORF type:complete len:1193 (+),score=156.97 GFUD01006160.1:67-3645(+)
MVAIAASALTADIFLQMTATLAHISKLQNTTNIANDKLAATDTGSLTFFDIKRDMDSIRTESMVDLVNTHVKMPCDSSKLHLSKIEWRCRGCFSISSTKETRIAILENDSMLTLIYPDRFSIVRERKGFALSVKPTSTEDSGIYFCLVNGRKEPFSAFRLAIQDIPSTPGKPLIMKFDSRSVELSWSPPLHQHHSAISHYIIHMLEGEDTNWSKHEIIQTQSAETSYNVTNLQPFSVYSFKVTAVNKIGLSNQSLPSYHMMTLREVPSGKPTITAAHNLSSNSIKILWRAPNASSINGEFLGYRISWKDRNSENSDEISSFELKDPTQTRYIISGLNTYTQYLVSLQVRNQKGLGPSSTVVVMTDEGVPSNPQNIANIHTQNDSVTLHWMEPESPNGIISGYRLYYMTKKMTDVVTVKDSSKEIIYMLKNLEPYTKYTILVKAFTSKHEGNSSDKIQVLTDVSGPGRPLITNLTCPGGNTLYVEWAQPEKYYHSVDKYLLYYKSRGEKSWHQRTVLVPPVAKHNVEKMLLTNLTTNQEYLLYIQAMTSSLYQEDLIYFGVISETHTLVVSRNCDGILVSPMREEELKDTTAMVSLAIVVGASAVFLILLVAVMSLAFWRRRKMRNHFYIPSSISQRDDMPLWDLESLDSDSHKMPIPTNVFVQHVDMLHADENMGFRKELDYILSAANAVQKNTEKRNDGIRLNMVEGYQNKKKFFVTTQGCKSETEMNTFWSIISEKAIQTVVIVDMNPFLMFPKDCKSFGSVNVIPCSESMHSGFLVKTFKIKRKKYSKKAENPLVSVYQYIPSKLRVKERLDFLRFVKHSYNANKSGGPILLFSSRNVLTYMTVSTMLQQNHYKNEMNIVNYVGHVLAQCELDNIQLNQYIFIHEVLTEAIIAGTTSVTKDNLPNFVKRLEASDVDNHSNPCWEPLEKQFAVSTEIHPSSHQYLTAVNPSNHLMNNSMDYVAIDLTRVVLHPPSGGTDYVNASWIPGFDNEKQFIISQHPNNSSLAQFWHMVWQTNTSLIICLSVFQQPFWPPLNHPLVLQGLKISIQNETSVSGYQSVCLQLEVCERKQSVQLIFCPNWPHLSVPVSNCVHLVDCVTRLSQTDKPTIVIDSFGATEASIFCVLSSLVRMMDLEDNVDVFYWFKSVHLCRPGVWVSPDNLLFLYRVMAELCSINKTSDQPIFSNIEVNI